MATKSYRKRANTYLSPDEVRVVKYLVVTKRDESITYEPKDKSYAAKLRKRILGKAYGMKIKEHPERVQELVRWLRGYIERNLPDYVPRLK